MDRPSDSSGQQLCQLCREINIERLLMPEGYKHHATLKAWVSSAATCELCSLLLMETLDNPMPAFNSANDNDINDKLTDEDFVQSHGISVRLLGDESYSRRDHLSVDLTSRFHPTESPVRLSSVFMFTDQNDPAIASGLPWKRELPSNTASEASFRMAESWLLACLQGHSNSTSMQAPFPDARFPYTAKRLVELSSTSVRVVDGELVKEPYATLSYCWGPGDHWPWGPSLIAKSRLKSELKQGLVREALPKTIREAAIVVERLGLRYLWVDAMCIQQNNVEEWLDQSTKMAAIYAEAQLNIAASCSPSNEAGLFNERSQSQHHLYKDCVHVDSNVYGKPSRLYFWHRAPDDFYTGPDAFRDEIDRGGLSKRAWVCQERIGSPRTLHFGETQLFWQCTHTLASEDNLGTKFPSPEDDRPWRSFFSLGRQKNALGFSLVISTGWLSKNDSRFFTRSGIASLYPNIIQAGS